MDMESYPRAEEALRLLAAAVGAARLYPATSALPREAVERFTRRANEISSAGPLRYAVERDGFHVSGAPIATGQSQVAALAESLYAMQVGQLLVVPGIAESETDSFVAIANADPRSVRSAGGIRSALGAAGVAHLAVVEVSLRASEESGILGLDLLAAPLDQIADQLLDAARQHASTADEGPSTDQVAEAIGKLEQATREIAMERVAGAMMRLDEQTRMRVLGLALKADTEGHRMDGMLAVIARMKPASLARLLKLVATQADTDPRRVATALTLPPESMKLLAVMLTPRPSLDPDFGLPPEVQAEGIARTIAEDTDDSDINRQVAIASPALSSGRALATATAMSRGSIDEETVRAIGEVLPQAARDGAFTTVREALRRLDEVGTEPSLNAAVVAARNTLADPNVLFDVCRAPLSDADAAIAGEILHAAGPAGAEALLNAYIRLPESGRSLLRPVMRGMSESVLGVARQRMRSAEGPVGVAYLQILPLLGDRRAIQVIADALNHLDEQMRFAAATALADIPDAEAEASLIRALNHREPETQRHVVREIGRARIERAVPAMSRALEDINVFQRTYETRKEIIGALEAIGTAEAEKALRKFARNTVTMGRKTRELRSRAIRVADELATRRGVSQP